MLVTEIKRLDSKKYCLYLDYEPYSIVYSSDIKRMKLVTGLEVTSQALDDFNKNYLRSRAMNKAVSSLKYGDRTVFQIKQKLKDAYFNNETIEYVIEKLSELSYIDDYRFTVSYINRCINKKSIPVIRYELSAKGISRDMIDRAFEETELPDAKDIVISTLNKKYTKDFCSQNRDKVIGFFLRKGYDYGIISAAISEYTENYTE